MQILLVEECFQHDLSKTWCIPLVGQISQRIMGINWILLFSYKFQPNLKKKFGFALFADTFRRTVFSASFEQDLVHSAHWSNLAGNIGHQFDFTVFLQSSTQFNEKDYIWLVWRNVCKTAFQRELSKPWSLPLWPHFAEKITFVR